MALIRSLRNNSAGGSGALRLYMLDNFKSLSDRACHADDVVDGDIVEVFCEPPVTHRIRMVNVNGINNLKNYAKNDSNFVHILSVAFGCTELPLPKFVEFDLLARRYSMKGIKKSKIELNKIYHDKLSTMIELFFYMFLSAPRTVSQSFYWIKK